MIRIVGLFELSFVLFFIGFFTHTYWLIVLGGVMAVLKDIMSIFTGILNPGFPVLLAVILAFWVDPWYMGIFWSSAIFAILDIPIAIKKIIMGAKITRS